MTKKSRVMILTALIAVLAAACIGLAACGGEGEGTPSPTPSASQDARLDPQVLEAPKASHLQISQSTGESKLSGKFSAEGELKFKGEEILQDSPGIVEMEWEFVPQESEKYRTLTGMVSVEFFRHRLTLEENGGFEVENVYFNDSVTLKSLPLTAKNEYRFDGWSESEKLEGYVVYPYTCTESKTLYAGYRFHTAEKLYYVPGYNADGSIGIMGVSQVENPKSYSYSPEPPKEDSISGEVIIADMYLDCPVSYIRWFFRTNVESVVFGNYIDDIGINAFTGCVKLTEITIPNTVREIDDEAFRLCINLKKLTFERGETELKLGMSTFVQCEALTEIALNRLKNTGFQTFYGAVSLERIVIPEHVEAIEVKTFTNCFALKEVIFEGNHLKEIQSQAFQTCRALKSLRLPAQASVSPAAFEGTAFEDVEITDGQIVSMVQELHEKFIGVPGNMEVTIIRDSQYAGDRFEADYQANTEKIVLRFYQFSQKVLDALIHEFFHHYQYVLSQGVGTETWDSLPVYADYYYFHGGGDNYLSFFSQRIIIWN